MVPNASKMKSLLVAINYFIKMFSPVATTSPYHVYLCIGNHIDDVGVVVTTPVKIMKPGVENPDRIGNYVLLVISW